MVEIYDFYINISKTIVYPDWITKSIIKKKHDFMLSESKYSRYYENRDSVLKRNVKSKLHINNLGTFYPLTQRHISNSYWKGLNSNRKLTQILFPLKLDSKNVLNIKSNNQYFNARLKIDLYMFGVTVINYRIDVNSCDAYSFANINELINNITLSNRSSINGQASLKEHTDSIAESLGTYLFKSPSKVNKRIDDEYHSILTIRNIREKPQINNLIDEGDMKNEISKKVIIDLYNLLLGKNWGNPSIDTINEYFRWRVKTQDDDLILFHPKRTIIIPRSPLVNTPQNRQTRKSIVCLRNNYENMLSLLFAMNKFLDISVPQDNNIRNEEMVRILKAISFAFPQSEESEYRYSYALKLIAKRINFDKRLLSSENAIAQ